MLSPRVKQVKALPEYKLELVFSNGERGTLDCKVYSDYECFAGIWNEDVFSRVVADHGTVMWPDGSDLCPDEIYDNSVKFNTNLINT